MVMLFSLYFFNEKQSLIHDIAANIVFISPASAC